MLRERPGHATQPAHSDTDDPDLNDLLQELRILLQGAQVLSGFLTILPFSEGFGRLDQFERMIFLVTFISSLAGLIFISAPAAQLVSNEVVGFSLSIVASVVVAVLIGVFWWLLPLKSRRDA